MNRVHFLDMSEQFDNKNKNMALTYSDKFNLIDEVIPTKGYPHFVVMNRNEYCFRFNCDLCGAPCGKRTDWWFCRSIYNSFPVVQAIIDDHDNVWAYDKTRMHKLRFANGGLEIRESCKSKEGGEIIEKWVPWKEGPFAP